MMRFFTGRSPSKSVTRPAPRRFARPALEALEDRWLPSTFTWFQPVDGNFNDPSLWRDQNNNPGVPGPGDDATIPGGITVTMSQSNTVNSLNSSASLEILRGVTFATNNVNNNAVLTGYDLQNGATLQVNGGVTFLQGGTIAGTLDVGSGATLQFLINTTTVNPGASFTGPGQYLMSGGVLGGPELTLNTDLTAPADFWLQNGVLDGPGTLTIPSGVTFSMIQGGAGGNVMGGTGKTAVLSGATLNVSGLGEYFDARTITNAGTINLGGTGDINIADGATLHNLAGGVINIQAHDIGIGSNSGAIQNDGSMSISSPTGSGAITLAAPFNNTGTVHVQSGQLVLASGGTNSGTFIADPGITPASPVITIQGTTYTMDPGARLDGAGVYEVTGGSTLQLNTTVSPAELLLDAGDVSGPGTLMAGALTWTGGTISAPITVAAGATATVGGTSGATLNATLTNAGTLNFVGTAEFDLDSGAILHNLAGAALNIQTDLGIFGGTLANDGTLTKTSPVNTGTTELGSTVNNTGTVSVASGVLRLSAGGTETGAWVTSAAGTLDLFGGTFTLNIGTRFSGAGTVRDSSSGILAVNGNLTMPQLAVLGRLTVNGSLTATNFSLSTGGTLAGAGSVTTTGAFSWTGGTIDDANGTVTVPAGAALLIQGNDSKEMDRGTLSLAGSTTWQDSGSIVLGTATINNQAGATFTIQSDESLIDDGGTLNNAGTLTKIAGPGTTSVSGDLNNNGGTVNVQSGALRFSGDYVQNAGTTSIAAGATLAAGGTVRIAHGTLTGTGTIDGDRTSGGTLSPGGSSAGALTVTGNYAQTATGTLTIDVGGATAGSQFDQLFVGGAATLAGTLSADLIGGFLPDVGNAFPVVAFASSSGAFATTSGLLLGSGRAFSPVLDPNDLTLSVTSYTPGVIQFTGASYSVSENGGQATMTLSRTSGSSGTVTAHYTVGGGTAVAGSDYVPTSGTVTFGPGVTSASFSVPVLDDGTFGPDRTLGLTLSNPTGGATLGSRSTAVLTITEADPPPSPPSSSMSLMPAYSTVASFPVAWSGSDPNGPGIAGYAIYVSDNGGPLTLWQSVPGATTSATYAGQDGHSYGFYSVATDTLGDRQPAPAKAQQSTLVDLDAPTSSATAAAAVNSASFSVSWGGSDGANGSGVAVYQVYVSDNSGPYTLFKQSSTAGSAGYTGADGHTYSFYSIATDSAGNRQPNPAAPQVVTLVDLDAPTSTVAALPATVAAPTTTSTAVSFAVTWGGSDGTGGSGVAGFQVYASDNGAPYTLLQQSAAAGSMTFTGQVGHSYAFYSVATDNAGNTQATPAQPQAATLAVLFADSFNRANASTLGANWTQLGGGIGVQGGRATVSKAPALAVCKGPVLTSTGVQATITLPATGAQYVGLVARYQVTTAGGNYYLGHLVGNSRSLKAYLYRYVHGAPTLIGTATPLGSAGSLPSGTSTLRLEVIGTSVKLFLNGQLLAYAFDSALASGTTGVWASLGATLGNFAAGPVSLNTARLPFADTFPQAAGSPLSRSWSEQAGNFQAQGNGQLLASDGGTSLATVNAAAVADVSVQANVALPATGTPYAGLVARYSGSGGGTYYVGEVTQSKGVVTATILRCVNGTLAPALANKVLTGGGSGVLLFQVKGNLLQLSWNGVVECSVTDTVVTAAGLAGVRAFHGALYSDLSVS
jgi:hypothetical protein